jgi:DNA-binding NtrC family response regulator
LQDFRMHQATEGVANGSSASEAHPGFAGDGPIVSIAELEKQAILGTIQQLHGDKLKAAKLLGIGKTTLYRKLKEYGISEAGGEE